MAYDDIVSGGLIIASEQREAFDEKPRGLLKRGRRTSNSSTASSSTPVGVLRLDDLPVIGGRAYMIQTSSLVMHSTVPNDVVRAGIYYTTDGSTPTGASTLMDFVQETVDSATNPPAQPVSVMYFPSVDQILSLLLAVARQSGTGAADLLAAATFPVDLYVIDLGVDPTNSGTSV